MRKFSNVKDRSNFYNKFVPTNSFLILFLIIATAGFYIIEWFFEINRMLEALDPEAPYRERAFIYLFLFPITWFFINYITKLLKVENLAIDIVEIVMWVLIIFLALNYLYDFSVSLGRVTNTYFLFWFMLCLMPIIGILAMQEEINAFLDKINIEKKSNLFYS